MKRKKRDALLCVVLHKLRFSHENTEKGATERADLQRIGESLVTEYKEMNYKRTKRLLGVDA